MYICCFYLNLTPYCTQSALPLVIDDCFSAECERRKEQRRAEQGFGIEKSERKLRRVSSSQTNKKIVRAKSCRVMVFPTNNRYCSYSCQRAHTHTYSPGHFITARSLFCFLMLQCNGGMKVYFIRISLQLDRQVQGKCKKEEHAENYFFFFNMAMTSNGEKGLRKCVQRFDVQHRLIARRKKPRGDGGWKCETEWEEEVMEVKEDEMNDMERIFGILSSANLIYCFVRQRRWETNTQSWGGGTRERQKTDGGN